MRASGITSTSPENIVVTKFPDVLFQTTLCNVSFERKFATNGRPKFATSSCSTSADTGGDEAPKQAVRLIEVVETRFLGLSRV